jgi:hypothetical protein
MTEQRRQDGGSDRENAYYDPAGGTVNLHLVSEEIAWHESIGHRVFFHVMPESPDWEGGAVRESHVELLPMDMLDIYCLDGRDPFTTEHRTDRLGVCAPTSEALDELNADARRNPVSRAFEALLKECGMTPALKIWMDALRLVPCKVTYQIFADASMQACRAGQPDCEAAVKRAWLSVGVTVQ